MSDTEKKQTASKAAVKQTLKRQTTVVYIGPDIPGALQYTVYNNGLPEVLQEMIKKHSFFDALVIPVEKLAWANIELAREGSALNTLYQRASEK